MTEPSRTIPNHCAATRKDGQPCTAPALGGAAYCFAHDPARAAARAAASAKGGRNKAAARRVERLVPATLRPLIGALLDAVGEVRAGDLDPKRATAMAALAGAVCRAYGVGVLEERIADLEAAAGRQGEGTPA